MRTRELVESIQRAKSSGEEVSQAAYRTLGEKILYVPLQTVRNAEGGDGGKKVRFLTLDSEGLKRVPAFSTEDLLFDWSSGDHQFLPVAGADLVMMLPEGTLLELDLGTNHNLLLSRAEMEAILDFDAVAAGPTPMAEEPRTEPQAANDQTAIVQTTVLQAGALQTVGVASAASGQSGATPQTINSKVPVAEARPKKPATETEIEDRLRKSLLSYPAVVEAYYLGAAETSFGGLLGLLVSNDVDGADWNTEQRFSLVEDVAEASRELFGYAGAIEVYDDLGNESSRSWDLFKSHKLFYRKDDESYFQFANSAQGGWSQSSENSGRLGSGTVPGLRLKLQERK